MRSRRPSDVATAARRDFPAVVRRAVHDLTQPLQAVRMMLDLPDVVVADHRELPRKLDAALAEIDQRLTQLQALARQCDEDAAESEAARSCLFGDAVALARRVRPELWGDGMVRVINSGRGVRLPPCAVAWVLNVLVDNARRARPRTRVLVGARGDGRWIVVADDGEGIVPEALAVLNEALEGGNGAVLGGGLSLARLLVSRWEGAWRTASRPGCGTRISFSTGECA